MKLFLWSRTKRINLIGFVAPSVSLFSSPTPGVLSRCFPPHATGRKNFQLPFFSNIVSCSGSLSYSLQDDLSLYEGGDFLSEKVEDSGHEGQTLLTRRTTLPDGRIHPKEKLLSIAGGLSLLEGLLSVTGKMGIVNIMAIEAIN
ncbi:hypothetical protein P9112_003189 [Eukaryota sp. TZLM1-RC]